MDDATRAKLLKLALLISGIAFFFICPLGLIWPEGWIWHGGEGKYYLHMILSIYAVLGVFLIFAARDPEAHRSLIFFTIWSSVAHAGTMAIQALIDHDERGHLGGDVLALALVAAVLWILAPRKAAAT